MKGRSGNSAYKFGGAPTKSYVAGVQSGNHSNPAVMKAAKSTMIGRACGGSVEGSSAMPRLDRPGRKSGGKVLAQGWAKTGSEDESEKAEEGRAGGGKVLAKDWAGTSAEKESDKAEMGRKNGGAANWIKGAVGKPGALRSKLNVPEGKNIPMKKLDKAANSSDPTLKKEAVLAKTFKGFKKG